MNKLEFTLKNRLVSLFGYVCLLVSFAVLDLWLRIVTREIGAYKIYEWAPNLFTLVWAAALTALVTLMPTKKSGRIVYGIVYYLCMVYAVVQYGAYLALGKFLFSSDFLFAGEGADYASWVVDILSVDFLAQVLALIAVGIGGLLVYPLCLRGCGKMTGKLAVRAAVLLVCAAALWQIPKLYGDPNAKSKWDDFRNPTYEYQQFTNVNFDMELTGLYQFVFRDLQVQMSRGQNNEADIQMIDTFFAGKAAHEDNAMTGILEGKNVIVVMMETMDDWMITPEDTPTLYRMMEQGINFTNMYTPQYSNGYTFNTEFAFNVSIYPYSNGNVAYSLLLNHFDYSIANRFADAGYSVNSYHVGNRNFYNRAQMHNAWGYTEYHCYEDYERDAALIKDDRFLYTCDALYEDLVADAPFFSYVISYTPHLPYTDDDLMSQIALAAYPEYDVAEDREIAILRAKARLTDDMFTGLLARLEADDLLEDTVIIAYGDHYAYGLTDRERLQQISEEAGDPILEKTPAFVYCADAGLSMEMEKVMQTTDLAPTILNLFGLEVPKEIMGQDVFDESYGGHVVFANGDWLTEQAYISDGAVVWNDGMTQEEIAQMNAYVQEVYQVNDAILNTDYYAHLKQ